MIHYRPTGRYVTYCGNSSIPRDVKTTTDIDRVTCRACQRYISAAFE